MSSRLIAAAAVLALAGTTPLQAQTENYLELLRADLRTEKMAIVGEAMQLTDAQAQVFWPLYREYDQERTALMDQRLALIKDYAANYEGMTDAKAKELVDRALRQDEDRVRLRRRYFERVSEALTPGIAARFIQVEHQLGLLLDIKIASEVPLLKPPAK